MRKSVAAIVPAVCLVCSSAVAAPPDTGVPEYNQSITRAAGFIRKYLSDSFPNGGYGSLCTYALVKAGEPKNSPLVQQALENVRGRIKDGYTGIAHGYIAGVDALFLAALDAGAHRAELQGIADHLQKSQLSNGSWDYSQNDTGDTSMAQYAALGLWSAAQAGVEIPVSVWDRMADWHLKTQQNDGGFDYKPYSNQQDDRQGSSLNMTANATSTLAIVQLNLYPDSMKPKSESKKNKSSSKRFGVLEARTEPEPAAEPGGGKPAASTNAATPLAALKNARGRGTGWLVNRYRPLNDNAPFGHRYYYVYALERSFALNKIETVGANEWYRATGDALVRAQQQDGSWGASGSEYPYEAAAYAILFFVRATKAAVSAQFGAGIMRGGRDFDLDNSEMGRDGQVKKKREITDPLDQLLTDLSKQDPEELFAAQQAIVEKVQLGDRKELLGQMDRIRKLITNDNAEIRRTAVWALGRSGDLRDAYLLINALEDTDVDVLVEAYNALSYLSRKISGVGIPSNPLAELEETTPNPTQAQIDATVDRWRREALKRWSAWYFRVRPYEERNDLFELRFGAAIGNSRGSR